jgi:hypothetical protein
MRGLMVTGIARSSASTSSLYFGDDIGQHAAVLVPGPQQLALDVDAVLGHGRSRAARDALLLRDGQSPVGCTGRPAVLTDGHFPQSAAALLVGRGCPR